MRLFKWLFGKFFGEFKRDVKWLTYFMIWRAVTVGLLFFGGISLIISTIVGGLAFDVSATTTFVWFTTSLFVMFVPSLILAVILFVVWFLHENFWILPLMIVMILVFSLVCFRGPCYEITCGNNNCDTAIHFNEHSDLNDVKCPSCNKQAQIKCSDENCGAINYITADSKLDDLHCAECDAKLSGVEVREESGLNLAKTLGVDNLVQSIKGKLVETFESVKNNFKKSEA